MRSGSLVIAALIAAAAARADAPARVFVAGIAVGAEADPQVAALLDDTLLVEARRHADRFEVLGTKDVQDILAIEAAKQALGCDSMSCASEIADALDAPQLVTGQIGRVGDRWLLTLTRTDRTTMKVLARTQREAATPDGLLAALPGQVDVLFEGTGPLWPLVGGGAAIGGLGAAVGVVGGALLGLAWADYLAAEEHGVVDDRFEELAARGGVLAPSGVALIAGGAAVLALGVVGAVVGLAVQVPVEDPS